MNSGAAHFVLDVAGDRVARKKSETNDIYEIDDLRLLEILPRFSWDLPPPAAD